MTSHVPPPHISTALSAVAGARQRARVPDGWACRAAAPTTAAVQQEADRPNSARVYDYLVGGAATSPQTEHRPRSSWRGGPTRGRRCALTRLFWAGLTASCLPGQGYAGSPVSAGGSRPWAISIRSPSMRPPALASSTWTATGWPCSAYALSWPTTITRSRFRPICGLPGGCLDNLRKMLSQPTVLLLVAVSHFFPDADASFRSRRDPRSRECR
jgi:hypothetical protein